MKQQNAPACGGRTGRPPRTRLGASPGRDARASLIHRGRNRRSKRDCSYRNAGANDGEDQRIFGGRSTRLIAQHFDKGLHVVPFPDGTRRHGAPIAAKRSGKGNLDRTNAYKVDNWPPPIRKACANLRPS